MKIIRIDRLQNVHSGPWRPFGVCRFAVATSIALSVGSPPAHSADSEFKTPYAAGPALTIPPAALAASLTCTLNVANATRAPVLLLSGTGNNTDQNFGWNWKRALAQAGIPYCSSDIQDGGAGNSNYGDMQTRGEYITYAIRTMYNMAHRKISILGHSQGGSIARYSLRFWPDLRYLVDDVIGMAPANHGTSYADAFCTSSCPPVLWQLRTVSRFNAAVNSYQETFFGISYTTIRTDQDTVVTPSTSPQLSGPGMIANVRIQDVCPTRMVDHVAIGTSDPVAEAIVMDALNQPGPAHASRIDTAVCSRTYMSGVNPITFDADLAAASAAGLSAFQNAPQVPAEPALRCYTLATGCR